MTQRTATRTPYPDRDRVGEYGMKMDCPCGAKNLWFPVLTLDAGVGPPSFDPQGERNSDLRDALCLECGSVVEAEALGIGDYRLVARPVRLGDNPAVIKRAMLLDPEIREKMLRRLGLPLDTEINEESFEKMRRYYDEPVAYTPPSLEGTDGPTSV